MKKPMDDKTPEMRNAIEDIFPGTKDAIENRKCPVCKKDIKGFRNAISQREYEISGMCQDCQDSVFGVD